MAAGYYISRWFIVLGRYLVQVFQASFFLENLAWYFSQMLSKRVNLTEMSRYFLWRRKISKYFACCQLKAAD